MTVVESALRMLEISLADVHPAEDNPRADLGDLTDLAASISSVGILEPLIVVARPEGGWSIVAGHRRHAAAGVAGLLYVPCVVREFTDTDRVEAMVIENLQRKDLAPLDEARGFEMLVELGHSQRFIAERVGVSQALVSKRLSLNHLPPVGREMLTAGAITVRQAEQLAQLPDDDLAIVCDEIAGARGNTYKTKDGVIEPWVIAQAITKVAAKRKHDAAEKKGIESGLIRLTTDPSYGQASRTHQPCKRADATHWYLDDNAAKIVWAHKRSTSSTDTATSASTATPAWKLQQEAEVELGKFLAELHERATGDVALAGKIRATAQEVLIAATDVTDSWRSLDIWWPLGDSADRGDDPTLYIATAVISSLALAVHGRWELDNKPGTMVVLDFLFRHGYESRAGVTLPVGYQPPFADTTPEDDPEGIVPSVDSLEPLPPAVSAPSKAAAAKKTAPARSTTAKKPAAKAAPVKAAPAKKSTTKAAAAPKAGTRKTS